MIELDTLANRGAKIRVVGVGGGGALGQGCIRSLQPPVYKHMITGRTDLGSVPIHDAGDQVSVAILDIGR